MALSPVFFSSVVIPAESDVLSDVVASVVVPVPFSVVVSDSVTVSVVVSFLVVLLSFAVVVLNNAPHGLSITSPSKSSAFLTLPVVTYVNVPTNNVSVNMYIKNFFENSFMFSPLLSHYLYFLRLAPLAIIFSIFYYLNSSNSNIEFFPVLELLIF